MNTGMLYYSLSLLKEDYVKTSAVSLVDQLLKHLRNLVANPAEPSFQQNLSNTLEQLRTNLDEAPSNNYHNHWHDFMSQMGWQNCYGKNLRSMVDRELGNNQITPSIALKQIEAFYKRIQEIQDHVNRAISSLEFMKLEEDGLDEGECEISIIIPYQHLNGKLNKFSDEIRQISKFILPPFVESVDEKSDGFTMRGLSSSDPTLFIAASPVVAMAILTAVKQAVDIYKGILEIKVLSRQLKEHKISTDQLEKQIDERFEYLVKQGVDSYLEKVESLKKSGGKSMDKSPNAGRTPAELRNRITSSLKNLVGKIDVGYTMDVRGEMHVPEENENECEDEDPKPLTAKQKADNKLIEEISGGREYLDYKQSDKPQLQKLIANLTAEDNDEK